MNGRWRLRGRRRTAHLLTIGVVGRRTGADWLPTFEFGLANDSSCVERQVRVSGAEGRFHLKLDARQSSSRWQPPALNVDRPTAAFEASELSLSTRSGKSGCRKRTHEIEEADTQRRPSTARRCDASAARAGYASIRITPRRRKELLGSDGARRAVVHIEVDRFQRRTIRLEPTPEVFSEDLPGLST